MTTDPALSDPKRPAFNLYDAHYGHLAADPHSAVRRETYDEDLGQASWITLAEAREWFRLLLPAVRSDAAAGAAAGATTGRAGPPVELAALEVACGSGGITCRMAQETGATCVGVDINPHAIEAATARARALGLAAPSPSPSAAPSESAPPPESPGSPDRPARVTFRHVDAARPLPFLDASFDALFCNDSFNHIPHRPAVLSDWHRVLRPGGRLLVTDPVVVTGAVTNEELRARSSIGFFLFTPAGHNERLLAAAGFTVAEIRDVTDAVATISARWRDARATRRDALVALEGAPDFDATQRFLDIVHTLASERRLSRFAYLAEKRA